MPAWILNEKRVGEIKKEILLKLEYHERHDDARFSEIRNDIWQMRVDDAARNAALVLENKAKDEKDKVYARSSR